MITNVQTLIRNYSKTLLWYQHQQAGFFDNLQVLAFKCLQVFQNSPKIIIMFFTQLELNRINVLMYTSFILHPFIKPMNYFPSRRVFSINELKTHLASKNFLVSFPKYRCRKYIRLILLKLPIPLIRWILFQSGCYHCNRIQYGV